MIGANAAGEYLPVASDNHLRRGFGWPAAACSCCMQELVAARCFVAACNRGGCSGLVEGCRCGLAEVEGVGE